MDEIISLLTKYKSTIIDIITVLAAATAIVIAYKRKYHKYVVSLYKIVVVNNWDRMTGYKALNNKLDMLIETSKSNYDANVQMMKTLGNRLTDLQKQHVKLVQEVTPNGGSTLIDMVSHISAIQWSRDYEDDSAIIVQCNSKGDVIKVNRYFTEITGRDPSEFMGSNWVNVVHPKDRERSVKDWFEAVRHGRDYESTVSITDIKDNEIKIRSRATRMLDNKGNIIGYYCRLELIS